MFVIKMTEPCIPLTAFKRKNFLVICVYLTFYTQGNKSVSICFYLCKLFFFSFHFCIKGQSRRRPWRITPSQRDSTVIRLKPCLPYVKRHLFRELPSLLIWCSLKCTIEPITVYPIATQTQILKLRNFQLSVVPGQKVLQLLHSFTGILPSFLSLFPSPSLAPLSSSSICLPSIFLCLGSILSRSRPAAHTASLLLSSVLPPSIPRSPSPFLHSALAPLLYFLHSSLLVCGQHSCAEAD